MNGYDFRLPSVMLINKGTWTPCYLMRMDFQQARCLSALCEPYNVLQTVASGPALSLCKCQTHFTKSLQIKLCNKCHNWFLDGQFQKLNWQLAQSRLVHLQKNFPLQNSNVSRNDLQNGFFNSLYLKTSSTWKTLLVLCIEQSHMSYCKRDTFK